MKPKEAIARFLSFFRLESGSSLPVITKAFSTFSVKALFCRRSLILALTAAFLSGLLADRSWQYMQRRFPDSSVEITKSSANVSEKTTFICPMHRHIVSEHPGVCPICGMTLTPVSHNAYGRDDGIVSIEPQVINNLSVKIAAVRRKTLKRRIDTPGFVQQIEPAGRIRVQAPFDARITVLAVKPGQWVESGQSLLTFESESLLVAERSYLELLKPTIKHGEQENTQNAAFQNLGEALDESRKRLQWLGLSGEELRLLEQNRVASASMTLHAPLAGAVANLQAAVGDTVKGGAALFELSGLARASMLANAFQRDAVWIQSGQSVEIKLPHVSHRVWPGVINQGAVSIDPSSQNIGVRLSFTAPAELLKSGMYAVATVFGDVRENVLTVPQQALIRTEAEDKVIVALGEGRFKPVPVQIGIETAEEAEIVDGLQEGDQVVNSAQFLLDSESSLQSGLLRMTKSQE
ncbi:MAG: efflux RND transporter periplasmic adaptor subunit [Methylomonas sp.]